MIKFSAVIITHNEDKNIERCLLSLIDVADEIVVLDSFSTDNTENICKKFNVSFHTNEFLGYGKQKNLAIEKATHYHIISLDADEALSEKLQQSILNLKTQWNSSGYYCNRLQNICGKWIKHSDYYPNRKIRVFDKRKGAWSNDSIHESVLIHDKNTQKLPGDILHWPYKTLGEFNKQMEKFSTLSAEHYYQSGKKATLIKLYFNPFWNFFKAYFLRLGFLDAYHGFMVCIITAYTTYLKYAKLKELQDNEVDSN